jgi:hypothetical protein
MRIASAVPDARRAFIAAWSLLRHHDVDDLREEIGDA